MRMRILGLAVGVFALTFGAQFPSTQAGVPIDQELAALAAAGGDVPVIVGVQAGFVPEGDLGGPAAVALQREAISRFMTDVTDRATAAGIRVKRRFDLIGYFTADVNAAQLAELAGMPGVASIGQDLLHRPSLAQSVPLIGANTSHAAGFTGAGWHVAILDTGVLASHPFMGGKVVAAAEACFGTTNASPGLLSTPLCPGGAEQATGPGAGANCSASLDGCDHGTHVAGIAAGSANVAGAPAGLSGVAPGASIIPIQVFSRFNSSTACGSPADTPCVLSYTSDQIAALNYLFTIAGPGNVNRIASANMSLGGDFFSSACDAHPTYAPVKAAIDQLRSIGIATVIATGNEFFTTGIAAPACISTSIAVGSTTKSDVVSSFSNRRPGMVSVMAPGSSITSSVPTGYASFNGTSMATPHVAGAWALLKQAAPGATVSQVLSALQSTGIAISDSASGGTYPRISVNAARLALGSGPSGAPGPPGAPTIGGSGNNIVISWTAPTSGGVPTSYTVVARLSCGAGILTTLPVGNTLSVPIPGAPNGSFCVSVQASNASGAGPESPGTSFSIPIVPPAPGAPTGLTASASGQNVIVSWNAPTTGGPVASYNLAVSGSINTVVPLPGSLTSVPGSGLPAGSYSLTLTAVNAGGSSPPSNTASFVIGATAPTMNAPVVSGGNVSLSWTNGAGGSAPTGFIVRARLAPGGPIVASLGVAGNSVVVPGVPGGTYYVSVQALAGSLLSAESNVVTVVVP